MCSPPEWRIFIWIRLKTRQTIEMMNIVSPTTSGLVQNLWIASATRNPVISQMLKIERRAPKTSALWKPQLYFLDAFRSAIISPITENPMPMTSEKRCAASDIIAIEFAI